MLYNSKYILLIGIFTTVGSTSAVLSDEATIVAFVRHTFRGVSEAIGQEDISLPGINISLPIVSYAQDASPRGLAIAHQYAGLGLMQATERAVKALDASTHFDGR